MLRRFGPNQGLNRPRESARRGTTALTRCDLSQSDRDDVGRAIPPVEPDRVPVGSVETATTPS